MQVGDRVRTNGGRVGTIRELVKDDDELVAHLDVEGEHPKQGVFRLREFTPTDRSPTTARELRVS